MKKGLAIFLIAVVLFSLTACGNLTLTDALKPTGSPEQTNDPKPTNSPKPTDDADSEEQPGKQSYDPNNLESMLSFIKTAGGIASMETATQASELIAKLGDSYSTYTAHKAEVTAFFKDAQARSAALYEAIYACSIDYYRCVAKRGLYDYSSWDTALSDLYDQWDDALGEYYDTWDEAFSDIYDICDELISDASDELEYTEYSNAWSAMYNEYSETWSEMYEEYSDTWSKLYSDYSSVWSSFSAGKTDIDDILSISPEEDEENGEESGASLTFSCSEIEAQIEAEIETALAALTSEWEALSTGIENCKDYEEKAEIIRTFYKKIENTSESLCQKAREYSLAYAEAILASGKSARDMYYDMADLYNAIYSDACKDIYNGIYNGLLQKMYKALYSGALKVRPEDVTYSAWSDLRSDEYDLWSDARSDTYDDWSDARSDIYDFYSDLRDELWDEDIEGAKADIEDFRKDIQ